MLQPAAGFEQQFSLIGHSDFNIFHAVLKMRFERARQIVDVHHGLFDARRAQPVEAMVDQRAPGDLDQRLGPGRRQRPHPLAEPRRQHHRRPRHRHPGIGPERERLAVAAHAQAAARPAAGTLASNQALTGAKAG
jgi:hypothetical protein